MENVCNVENHDGMKDRGGTCGFTVALVEFLNSSRKDLNPDESSLLHCNKQHFRHKTLIMKYNAFGILSDTGMHMGFYLSKVFSGQP